MLRAGSKTLRKMATLNISKIPCLRYPSPNHNTSDNEAGNQRRRRSLIFFIPGNPGLVDYYIPYLSTLRNLLNETETRTGYTRLFDIYGQNLIGFADADHDHPFGSTGSTAGPAPTAPFSLEDQIRHFYDRVVHLNSSPILESNNESNTSPYDEVIIMGHSVGAYISLEVCHRHHLFLKDQEKTNVSTSSASQRRSLNLKAGILLFPAVSHLAKSSNGQKLNMIRQTPFLDRHAHHIAKRFVDLFPSFILEGIVRRVLGFSPHGAAVTTRFLTSRDGIWQAIHLGKDELGTITEEKWAEEMWEAADEVNDDEVDKFYFYFGEKDHWVADESRDEFIAARQAKKKDSGGRKESRTRIVVDENKIPHAFCIREFSPFHFRVDYLRPLST